MPDSSGDFIELTAEIVSAYVSNNTVAAGDIPGLINQVHAALSRVSVNTSITTLAVSRTATSLIAFNDHAHLIGTDRSLLTYR